MIWNNDYFRGKSKIIEKRPKILVTGGTGFLGSHIIKQLLQDGFAVKGLKRATGKWPFYMPAFLEKQVSWAEGDILDIISLEDAMQGVDAVIHAAAVVSFNKNDRNKMYKVNIEGTANVVNVALDQKIARLVYVSSIAALGRAKENHSIDENSKWEDNSSNTHYAISKYRAELEVWRGMEEGLNGVIINPATILGFGDWETGSNGIFKNIYDEYGWYTTGTNGFVDVEDVAKAAVELLKSNITEERFIVAAENLTFRKLFDTMADGFKKRSPDKKVTSFIAAIAWRIEKLKSFFTGKTPLITRESAAIAQSNTTYDNSKLLKALPDFQYKPLDLTIKEATAKYLSAL